MLDFFKKNNYTAPAIIISLGAILTGFIFSATANNFATKSDTISVNGTSERIVKSDTAKWTITISARTADLKSGIFAIQKSENELITYLKTNKINDDSIIINNVTNSQVCVVGPQGYENCALGITGYNFNQSIIVELNDVDLAAKLSKDITSKLLSQNLTSNVEYYYNNLKNVRAEMLSEATSNALERANSVAKAGGASIGKITSLSSGVFQVTPKNSVNFDDYGTYDTTEIDKKITATVKANFSLH